MGRMGRTAIFAVAAVASTTLAPSAEAARPAPTVSRVSAADPAALAAAAYARMTPQQRVGQLFMAGITSTGATGEQLRQLAQVQAGNAFLRGHNRIGVAATRAVTDQVAATTTVNGVRPLVSADQEGGRVQALRGPGFSRIKAALAQGGVKPAKLQVHAAGWGAQLAAAGVNLDLAPVADTVPARIGEKNLPIGLPHREFGHRTGNVARHVGAFVRGLNAGGVGATLKHYPSIGRATGNTDSKASVTDPTGPGSPFLKPFQRGIDAGAMVVMVSSARYPKIDPTRKACFSPVVMRTLLRERQGFTGIVLSDSFGASSVAHVGPGERAVRYFEAGGTMLLDTNSDDLQPMTDAVLARAAADPAYAAIIEQAVRLVLTVKARAGLVA